MSRWSNRPERLLRELHRTIGSGGLVKCPCSPKTRQLHSFLQIKQAPNEMDRGCPLSNYIALLHQLKEVEVFTAWPAKSTWMMLASFAFEIISLSLSPRPCKASVLRLVHAIMFVDEILFVQGIDE